MKAIGLIGGMSWESSAIYYRIINERTKEKLGGLHSAKSIMYTVDFEEIAKLQQSGDWDTIGELMSEAAMNLQKGGADFVLICCNTQYKVAAEIESAMDIPLIHIGDVTADAVVALGIDKVGLLGTKYTMEQDFISNRFVNKGIDVITPDEAGRKIIQDTIYTELAKGIINPESLAKCVGVINELKSRGAKGIILGCTELGMLITPESVDLPLFDTTVIHAEKAVELALS
ncbi:aspartate/glutamate racemase family protein [Mucilaginibacter ginkgonis]|uniref:Aspartate/glutamate racemase family protein n=1 Tax=Mucilaginibacter ginkgonis TaxID=2682091 RepID=A0A6I4I3Q5_9SPHI|nr:aspartate/glutamate racemase family protein [Mucilaginibacter ginkgonis]QQL48618.1 aspartate/glutamate racemase family protein [Mucilaginibacter ginkgonis]